MQKAAHFFGTHRSGLFADVFFLTSAITLLMNSSFTPSEGGRASAGGQSPAEVESISRRSFLGVLLGFGSVVVGTALSVPLIRFALHPLLTNTTEIGWSDVGKIEEFASLTAPTTLSK
jgi:hypothetical protein